MSATTPDSAPSPGRARKLLKDGLLRVRVLIRFRRELKLRRKYALLIGIEYNQVKGWGLDGTEHDISTVQNMLIRHHGYKSSNIVILSDALEEFIDFQGRRIQYYKYIPPTQENIVKAVRRFVRPGVNADYFFMFSGHSSNREDPEVPSRERDGREEYMLPCDAFQKSEDSDDVEDQDKIITDKFLNDWLVKRVQSTKGSRLFSILDCCHSGTLLNLLHRRCHQEGNSFTSKVRGLIRHRIVEPIYRNLEGTGYLSRFKYVKLEPEDVECLGFCPCQRPSDGGAIQAQIVCISACTDSQVMVNVGRGGVVIQKFVEVMSAGPGDRPITYRELMAALREVSHSTKMDILRTYGVSRPLWSRIMLKRKIRFDPQLSSIKHLNLDLNIEI